MNETKPGVPAPESAPTYVPDAQPAPAPAPAAPKKKRRKKRLIALVIVAVIVVGGAVLALCLAGRNSDIEPFPEGPFFPSEGQTERYAGIIEPQKTLTVARDPARTVAQVFVKPGDNVTKGQQLFSYDTEESALTIRQATLELDGIDNNMTETRNQIAELEAERKAADKGKQLEYTIEIQQLQSQLNQLELDSRMKSAEIESLKKAQANAVVTAEMDGVVRQINTLDESGANYITISAVGAYRVKAKIDELHVASLSVGTPVTVYARTGGASWKGTVSAIDTETPADADEQGGMMMSDNYGNYGEDDVSGKATSYYFYVTFDTADALLLGQHVYVEPVPAADEDVPEAAAEDGVDADTVIAAGETATAETEG